MNSLLLDTAKEQLANSQRLIKQGFTPPPLQAPQGMPPGGAAPPGAPPGAAAPPMPPGAPPGDPAAQGGPPGGMPPPDAAAAAGGAAPPPADPSQDPIEQIRQVIQQEMARAGQAGQAGQGASGPAATSGGGGGSGGSGGKGKANEQTAALAAMDKKLNQVLKLMANLHARSGHPMPEDLYDESPALSDPNAQQQPAAQPAQKAAELADLGAAEAPIETKADALLTMLRQASVHTRDGGA